MKFRAKIEGTGKTAAGIVVPPTVVEALGTSKRPAVKVTINKHTYRSTIAMMGGDFMLPVSNENREMSGTKAGDVVEIEVVLDTEPRVISTPYDFQKALDKEPKAKAFYEGLSYSNKQRFVLSIEGAKAADTRLRRIEKSVAMLKEGKV